MSQQYDRKAIAIVGDDNATKIEGLKFTFTVTRTVQGYPNTIDLNIYNLNRTTQSKFEKKDAKLIFFAGYKDNVKTIFSGNIKNVTKQSNGVDSITTVHAGDGDFNYINSTVSETFSGKSTLLDIVKRLAASFSGVTIGKLGGLDNKFGPLRSSTYEGKTSDELNTLAVTYGFDWKINNNIFTTIAVGDSLDNEAILISPRTGLLDPPTVTEIGANVRTMLNPSYVPRGKVKIDTSESIVQSSFSSIARIPRTMANGVFPIIEVIHMGDTHGEKWDSSIQCVFNLSDIV